MRLIICAECNASRLYRYNYFQNSLSKYFNILDKSLSNGTIEDQKTLLDVYTFDDQDVFIFGGIQQEPPKITKESLERNLNELFNKVFNKYPNSKIIFWNTIARTDHPYNATQNLAVDVKESFVNNKNIFSRTFRVEDEKYTDHSHYTKETMDLALKDFTDYIVNIIPTLLNKRFDVITPMNTMEFDENKNVTFILMYPPVKETVTINCINHDGKESNFSLIVGKNVQGDGRLHIFKHPRLKKITFSDNATPVHCLKQNF